MNVTASLSKQILSTAIHENASDIHYSPTEKQTDIYFRVNGRRIFHSSVPTYTYNTLLSYYKFTSGMDIGEIRKPQNGTLSFQHLNQHFSLRLSTLPVNSTESLAIRLLPQNEKSELNQLFLFPNQLQRLKQSISRRSGIILFTGPTGSGKTTTLYALLEDLLKENAYQTITLEDPIEKKLSDILQVQVNEKAGISYDVGLKAALRHDPDILMVGEIRDKETAHFAFRAAHTGHLVLSTLHAKNAYGTILRLLEMGVKKVDLEQNLLFVAAIELLPIYVKNMDKRAAILEILEDELLISAINGITPNGNSVGFQSFQTLRRKAYAFGFTNQASFDEAH
ncbi:Flp pilus assembly complex ATPase component TadA [Aquibacillus sp. 3ASR75-11]|uniref:Flp pilus assembly complex ATPase component TadA n=1 Tax=Terrihalobacillus insolitus TaxID=2950438 RepID=A0A9X4ANX9_9BACI|nr:competence type IV pilus ATPase ComGA [Terrihalobacillus insolitus]MDC3413405.1 Flp pilus assembly complex ATPase component TadA [Terrihalobacillus insolitus]MDC3424988.1 Flp pilus assembly complex ATPase component TadA [Terrihalobacillus insolitus]